MPRSQDNPGNELGICSSLCGRDLRACFPLELDLFFFSQSSMVREGGQELGRAPAKTRTRETGRKKYTLQQMRMLCY